MLFEGSRYSIPSSQYGKEINVMEAMGWSWQELCDAPADLVDEIGIMTTQRAKERKQKADNGAR